MLTTVVCFIFLDAFFTSARCQCSADVFKDEASTEAFLTELRKFVSSYFKKGGSQSKISNGNCAVNSLQKPSDRGDVSAVGCGKPPDRCPETKYRSFDGSCNNMRNPVWGMPNTQYNRLLPAYYEDKISNTPLAKSGRGLPTARSISLLLFPDIPVEDTMFTLITMQFGQIITHDMGMAANAPKTQPSCCSKDGQLLELANVADYCYPILLPSRDPVRYGTNKTCMTFARTTTNRDRRCVRGSVPAEQLTSVSHFLDLSVVYGNSEKEIHLLRHLKGGRLLVETRNGQQWPPRALNPSGTCLLKNPDEACYQAGDTRVNQSPQLTVLQVVLLREHNRIANKLSKLNPDWNDETLFQEARKINIAEYQYISYYEWMPYILGWENSVSNKLVWNTRDFVNDYDEEMDPTVLNEHSAAAFRHFHSLISGQIHLVNENRDSEGSFNLSDRLFKPEIVETYFDDLARGMTTQPQSASDQYYDSEITQFLFKGNDTFGIDLRATDIQRGRDHGLATYNDYRALLKIGRAERFEDFSDLMTTENIEKLASLYETPDDVDLSVGGTLEVPVPGSLVGPTFIRIMTEQFYRTRVGDRFWFENQNKKTGFTLEQLQQIRKASMSRLLCDNTNDLQNMQPKAFERLSRSNQLTSCGSLPSVDLSAWKN